MKCDGYIRLNVKVDPEWRDYLAGCICSGISRVIIRIKNTGLRVILDGSSAGSGGQGI